MKSSDGFEVLLPGDLAVNTVEYDLELYQTLEQGTETDFYTNQLGVIEHCPFFVVSVQPNRTNKGQRVYMITSELIGWQSHRPGSIFYCFSPVERCRWTRP